MRVWRASASWVRVARWGAVAAFLTLLFYGAVGFASTSVLIGDNPRWRGMDRGPQDFGLEAETVSLTTSDGVLLRAWWLPAASPVRGSIVIAHGIDHTRQVMLSRAVFLVRAGYNVLTPDLRGHGESGGNVVSPGFLEATDLMAAERFARQREPNAPVAVLGVSYGAVAALLAAGRSAGFAAVIADGAFPTGRSVYLRILDHFAHDRAAPFWLRAASAAASAPGLVSVISFVYYARTGAYLGPDFGSLVAAAPRVRAPVLLISGGDDWMVPPADARRLQAALSNTRSTLVIIPHGRHDTTYTTAPAVYEAAVLSFLAGVMDGARGDSAAKP
jgi:uncharacterized protein